MADTNKLCMGCMRELPDFSAECPHCKYEPGSENGENDLSVKTLLESRYIVGKTLSGNGEGITYLGFDSELNAPVRIREFFPLGICERINTQVKSFSDSENVFNNEKEEFLTLARSLARMRGLSAILPVYDIFEANGTAYVISEIIESITLRDFLIRNGGSLTIDQVRPLFMPIMSTLSSLHAIGIIHRGISPDTLIIGKDGKLRLTEFSIANARTSRSDIQCELFKGYAAIEQYGFNGEQGPWTDVYAIAATIYRALVGSPPPEASARVTNDKMIIPAQIADALPAYVLSGLANALQILPEERTKNIEVFRDEFSAAPSVVVKEIRKPAEVIKTKNNGTKKYAVISALITLIIIGILAGAIYIFAYKQGAIGNNNNDTTIPTIATESTQVYSNTIIDPNLGSTPNLRGYLYADIMSSSNVEILKITTNYKITISSKQYSDKTPGEIISQEPKEGSDIKKGDAINVVVSLGPEKFSMPRNLLGLTREEAEDLLWELGFRKQNISWSSKYLPTEKPDTVVDVSPSVGEEADSEMYVTVYINSYKPETTTTRPPTIPPSTEDNENTTNPLYSESKNNANFNANHNANN